LRRLHLAQCWNHGVSVPGGAPLPPQHDPAQLILEEAGARRADAASGARPKTLNDKSGTFPLSQEVPETAHAPNLDGA
jgi:hypothetical protein